MSQFNGKTVLITGGASGIGKLMGELALKKGAELIIWDINQAAIDETLIIRPLFCFRITGSIF